MTKALYSFRKVDGHKCLQPYVPVNIINPYTGSCCAISCLLDSGADKCLFPDFIVKQLGSVACGPQNQSTGISGSSIDTRPHQLKLELLFQDYKQVFWTSDILKIDCADHDNVPPLLGSSDFLCNFNVTFNYKNGQVIVLET